ncbi:MAG TPA: T9SS type A sorting domain-containing protein, partial [Puia sp.]
IPLGSQAYSVFGVWSTTTANAFQHVWEQKGSGSANDAVEIWTANTGNYGAQLEIGPYFQGAVLPYTTNNWYASQIDVQAISTSDLTVIDQSNLKTGGVVTDSDPNGHDALSARINGLSTDINRLGARNVVGEEPLTGNIAEVIVYTTPVSGAQRNQIFSYLALKHGIHIGTDLVNSAGTKIWDATANTTYNNAVFGIGQDDGSSLTLTKSNSAVTGSGNGAGQSGAANITLSNPSTLANGSFLVIGNDGGGLTEGTGNLPVLAAGSQRLARQWKAQVTGTPGDVDVDVDLTGITVTGTTNTDFRLILDDDGDGDFTTGTTRFYTPSTFTANVAHFATVTINNNTVAGVITSAAPGTPLPVVWQGFTAVGAGNDVNLSWQVSANEMGREYVVEHSLDGAHFSSVGQVANIASQKSYTFTHVGAGPGLHYYRVHEVDLDGKEIYSKILSVSIKATDFSVKAMNNPVIGSVDPNIEINAVRGGKASIEIWTETGRLLGSQQLTVGTGSNRITVPLGAKPKATYFLKVTLNETTRTIQVVKL